MPSHPERVVSQETIRQEGHEVAGMTEFHPHDEPCHRCSATAWEWIEVFEERNGKIQDVVSCVFCGLRVRVKATPRPKKFDAVEFRFQFGRFKGLTFAEADAEPNGRRYLEVLRDTNEKLRDRIAAYLALTEQEVAS